MTRLTLVTGGPKTGKTTAHPDAFHTDDLGRGRKGWDDRIQTVAQQIRTGSGVIEGVIVPHALERALKDDPHLRLDDVRVEFHTKTYGPLSPGQQAMSKAVQTVWRRVQGEVTKRGGTVG